MTSPGGTTARGLAALERGGVRAALPTRWTRWWALMEARQQIADFLGALLRVYTLIIIAWIIVSWMFSLGVRVPYSRPLNAVLDFLRDVTNPYLRIFRRLPLQFGPIDFSPIVAIIVLQIVGGIIVEPDRVRERVAGRRCRRAGRGGGRRAPTRLTKAIVRAQIGASRAATTCSSASSSSTRATRGVAFGVFSGGGPLVVIVAVVALGALLVFFAHPPHAPLVWLPTGLLLGGAAGNLIDRVRDGAVTDFIEVPALAGVQRRRHLRSRSAC